MTPSYVLLGTVLLGFGQTPPKTADFDKAALVWTIPWDNAWVTSVSFVGSEKRLAAGNMNGELYLWDLPAPQEKSRPVPRRRLEGHGQAVTHLAATRDGRALISTSYDGTVRWWDPDGLIEGNQEAVFDRNAREQALKKAAGKPASFPPGPRVEVQLHAHMNKEHTDWIRSCSLSPSGGKLLTGDDKGLAILWDVQARKELKRFQVPGWLTGLALSPDARSMVTVEFASRYTTFKNAVGLWDVGADKPRTDLTKECPSAAVAAFSTDGKLVALGRGGEIQGDAPIFLVDVATGKKRWQAPGHKLGVTALLFHPDGKHLLSCGRDTVVRIWRNDDGNLVKTLGQPRGGQFNDWLHDMALSPDGMWLATADMAGFVQVWKLSD